MSKLILTQVAGGIATVTLHRPDKLNAFAEDMRERLAEALDVISMRDDVRVLVLTGAGRAFCAGGDVKHMAALKEREESFVHAHEPGGRIGHAGQRGNLARRKKEGRHHQDQDRRHQQRQRQPESDGGRAQGAPPPIRARQAAGRLLALANDRSLTTLDATADRPAPKREAMVTTSNKLASTSCP